MSTAAARFGDIVQPVKLSKNQLLAVVVALGGFVAFVMAVPATQGDVERMTASLATKEAVAALPTKADVAAVDLRETVAALRATVDAQREAQREASDAQREALGELRATVAALSTTVDALSTTVAQASNTVIALSSNVDRIREAADSMNDTVGTLGSRLDSLSNIVSPLVPCVIELNQPWLMEQEQSAEQQPPPFPLGDSMRYPRLPESCEQARERARLAQ